MEKLIKVREFSERTGMSREDIYRYIKSGVIRAAQPGGKRALKWIPESEVERILSQAGDAR